MTALRQPLVDGPLDTPLGRTEGFGPVPPPRRARNLAGALLGALLVVVCASAVAVYTADAGHRHAVLVVTRPVKAGTVIGPADVGEARISADPAVRSVPGSERDQIVGQVAGVNLVVGTLVTRAELATGPLADARHAVVGLALKAGQFPDGLQPLDQVMLIDTGPAADSGVAADPAAAAGTGTGSGPEVLVGNAEVADAGMAPDGQTTVISVIVPVASAPVVAAESARGQVSVVLRGGPAG